MTASSLHPAGRAVAICFATMTGLWTTALNAHPLGNDSITHFSVLYILPDRVELDFVLDIAETQSVLIQTNEMDTDKDGIDSREEQTAWLDRKAIEFIPHLRVAINDTPLAWTPVDEAIDPLTGHSEKNARFIDKMIGFAGMPTYRLLIRYVAPYPSPLEPGTHQITYKDAIYPQIPGLKRIILDRTGYVASVNDEQLAELKQGRLAETLLQKIARKRIEIDPDAVVEEVDADQRWRIHDGDNIYVVQRDLEKVRIYTTPGVRFIAPHPTFWDEGVNPMVYEQYAPDELPAETEATINFRVLEPFVATTTPTSAPATQPAIAANETQWPERFDAFLENDPSKISESQSHAKHIIDLLSFEGEQGSWGIVTLLTITALCFFWGAGHALMPGHAKTVVAAYLISQKGTYWHAIMLAIIVTVTHTALVVILGVVIWAYPGGVSAALQNLLGVVSGLLVAGMGAVLSWRALSGRILHHHHDHDHSHDEDRPWYKKLFTHSHPHVPHHHHHGDDHHHHHHDHGHGHSHDHDHDHSHTHTHEHHSHHTHDYAGHTHHHHDPTALTMKTLLVLGITGGIVPCPTATIIMFLGIGAKKVLGALYAVGIFSLGLALTLMLVGFLALSSRKIAARIMSDEQNADELSGPGKKFLLQAVPAASGLVVVLLGLAITVDYVYFIRMGTSLFGLAS